MVLSAHAHAQWGRALGRFQGVLMLGFRSEVYRARSRKTGVMVALKKIIMHHEKDGVRIANGKSKIMRRAH